MRERAAEKVREMEKEKEREPAKDGHSGPKRENGVRRREGGGWRRERDRPAAAALPGVLSTPTISQHEAKQALSRTLQQAPPTDTMSGTPTSANVNPPPPRVADMVDEAETETEEYTPPPTDS